MDEEITPTEEQTLTIQQAIDLAVQHHTGGDLPKAEGIYSQILQTDPNQPVALHLLGVIAHQVDKNDIAVDLITKALTIKPDYAEAHSNLGNAFHDQGKLEGAIASYNNAIAIKPDYVWPLKIWAPHIYYYGNTTRL
jgi:protein O-GlcNAc transferase